MELSSGSPGRDTFEMQARPDDGILLGKALFTTLVNKAVFRG